MSFLTETQRKSVLQAVLKVIGDKFINPGSPPRMAVVSITNTGKLYEGPTIPKPSRQR